MRNSHFYTAPDGTKIWCTKIGSGPPMILCDGFACDGYIWPYVIDHFCEHYSIIRWHYRGHGYSDTPKDLRHVTIADLCADLRGVLDLLEVDGAILSGHSMGVQLIFEAFAQMPGRFKALIPMCGTYEYPLETFNDSDILARALPYLELAADLTPKAFQALWTRFSNSQLMYLLAHATELNSKLIYGRDFKPYLEHTSRMDVTLYVSMLRQLSEHSAAHILPTIDIPTLIIASEFDSFTPFHRSEAMRDMIPNCEMVVLPGASHAGPLELPDTVIGATEKFLKEHGL